MTDSIEVKNINGVTAYNNILYPEIELNDDDIYIISMSGDRLDNLSYEFYQNTSNWWIIAIANGLNNGSMYVTPGLQIRIPNDTNKILTDYERLNVNI